MSKETYKSGQQAKNEFLATAEQVESRNARDEHSRALYKKSIDNENARSARRAYRKLMTKVGAVTLATGILAGPMLASAFEKVTASKETPTSRITVESPDSPAQTIVIKKGGSIYEAVNVATTGDPRPIVDQIVAERGTSAVQPGESINMPYMDTDPQKPNSQ